MKKLLVLAVLAPALALAQGVTRAQPQTAALYSWSRNATLAAATNLGGIMVPGKACTITSVAIGLITNSGGGAGTTVVSMTDGTNTCTATFACSDTGAGAPKALSVTAVGSAGSGCSFPVGAAIWATVPTTTCTSTQVGAMNVTFSGYCR